MASACLSSRTGPADGLPLGCRSRGRQHADPVAESFAHDGVRVFGGVMVADGNQIQLDFLAAPDDLAGLMSQSAQGDRQV